jgi:hypothetical protein
MSWWSVITTRGRLLQDVCLTYTKDEIRIIGLRLFEGDEGIAILIDNSRNNARLYAPFEECKRLAALHQYELVLRRRDGETFTSYVRRFLSITH